MAAYVIVNIGVEDAASYEEYKGPAAATVTEYGGRYLARGGTAEALEGDWKPRRLVILEFPSTARAREWWNSQEYAPLKALRQRCASTEMVLVEGI
ncbi:MAG: DUF1330 domain-containing protein [Acidobacteria bacterium]|nr:DUF1330 domain-containing protein [Acidobacteriota bacterium]